MGKSRKAMHNFEEVSRTSRIEEHDTVTTITSDPALTRWPIANTGGVDCAIVLSISTVSLRRQCTLVLYLGAGVVEEWLSEGFGAGRCIDRHFEICAVKFGSAFHW